jgi:hypothetical protein
MPYAFALGSALCDQRKALTAGERTASEPIPRSESREASLGEGTLN